MASIRQDVDSLKRESMSQHDPSREADDDGTADETGEDSPQLVTRPLETSSSSSLPKTASNGHAVSWAEEMDMRDPLLDDDTLTKDSAHIAVVPVTSHTNQFLDDAFTKRMTGAERRDL